MNQKNRNLATQRLRELIKHPFRLRGFNSKNTLRHEFVKAQIAIILNKQGYDEIYLESPCVGGGRPDLIVISKGQGYIIEVLETEKEEKFLSKKDYYPGEFTLIPVRADEFDPETWNL
jgi:hypothetical protein